MKNKRFKVICTCLAVLVVIIGIYHEAVWPEKVLVGRWYLIDQDTNTYSTSKYMEFYEDGSWQAGDADYVQYGEWKIKTNQIWLRSPEENNEIHKINYEIEDGKYLKTFTNVDGEVKETKLVKADKVDEW